MKTRGVAIGEGRKAKARSLRRAMTDEEAQLWTRLKEHRRKGLAFRRQVALGPYVVDFLCRKANLIVEVDGTHHGEGEQKRHDEERDAWLEGHGYTVLRYWNSMIWTDIDGVLDDIDGHLKAKGFL